MKEVRQRASTETKRETVEAGLRILVRLDRQTGIRKFRGKVKWEGNLNESKPPAPEFLAILRGWRCAPYRSSKSAQDHEADSIRRERSVLDS
jgi:hypothetical protein